MPLRCYRILSTRVLLCATLASIIGLCTPVVSPSQEFRKVTLTEAIDLALKNNHGLLIGIDKVSELRSATRVARSSYFPQLTNSSSYLHFTQTDVLEFSPGAFGTFAGLGVVPASNLQVKQGEVNNEISRTQFTQPLTQLFKIHDAHRIAEADESASRDDLQSLRNQVALVVRQLYYGLLTVQLEQETAAKELQVAEEQVAESEQDFSRGNALAVALIGAKASALEAKQSELTARIRHSDLEAQFNDVLGLPQGSRLELEEQTPAPLDLPGREECLRLAESAAPEIKSAEQVVQKAQAAVDEARAEYIPDISFFARYDYQNGVPFLFHNYGVVGFNFTYTLFDGGKKRAVLREREAQRAQALENLQRLKDDAGVNVQKALNKVEQSRSLIDVARQAVALREEADRLAGAQLHYAVILNSKRSQAISDLTKARADLLKAELGYMESQAELTAIIGRLPR